MYRIQDPLLRFWFTFVYPHASSIERLDSKMVYSTLVAPQLDAYRGVAFESLAAELFLSGELLSHMNEPFKVGTYWDKQIQIDFVIALQSGLSYFGETKWHTIDTKTAAAFVDKLSVLKTSTSYQAILVLANRVTASSKQSSEHRAYSAKDLTRGK